MDPFTIPTLSYGTVDAEYANLLATTDPTGDGPLWMVNLMRYRPKALYADGRSSDLTGQEADDRYAPFDSFRAVGAELVFLSEVAEQLVGDTPPWHRVAVVKYPNRRAFVDMMSLPGYLESHVHKDAGMESTIILGCRPVDLPPLPSGAPELVAVPHPSSDEDGPVVILHVLRYQERQPVDAVDPYQGVAGAVAVAHGARIGAWLDCEGVVVGDGRSWDHVRFTGFPSLAAFHAVAFDPDRLAAQMSQEEPEVADACTLVLRPLIDRLPASLAR